MAAPRLFDLQLAPLALEAGGHVTDHRVRGWGWGPGRGLTEGPVVLIIHALTGDAHAGGDGGWWHPVIGPGRPLDPERYSLLCFNNLGGCYGTAGPGLSGFPTRAEQRIAAGEEPLPSEHAFDGDDLPAIVTPWDQARSLLMALDQLGVERIHLVTGGSLGAMITLCVAALAPHRVERICPIAGCEAASSWIIGFNHVARQMIRADDGPRGLELARQLAMLTYRAEPGLDRRQGRKQSSDAPGWQAGRPYRVQTYLEHQGQKLVERFDPQAYLCQLSAMDHHDVHRHPRRRDLDPAEGICASTLAVGIDTDALYLPGHGRTLAQALSARGVEARYAEITSLHGHDGFLIEFDQLAPLLEQALDLPPGGGPPWSEDDQP